MNFRQARITIHTSNTHFNQRQREHIRGRTQIARSDVLQMLLHHANRGGCVDLFARGEGVGPEPSLDAPRAVDARCNVGHSIAQDGLVGGVVASPSAS